MPRPKLLLHPGTHKTGTTAIQKSLNNNRSWLAAQGIAYPQLRSGRQRAGAAHHVLAKALVDADDRQLLQHYYRQVEQASGGARLTVLSAEPIYRLELRNVAGEGDAFFLGHKAYLERLRQLFCDFDVSVLIYFRRPDSFAVSHFKTLVANGRLVGPFGDYVNEVSPWLYEYPRHIALFRDIFGSVEKRCYEVEVQKGLIAGFYSAFDVREPPTGDPGEIRVSHGNRATLWLHRARNEHGEGQAHQQRALFASENACSPLFTESEPSTLWPSDAAFAAFVERYRSAYEIGPFDLPKPPSCPATRWTEDMHAAAEVAFTEWRRANAERLSQRAAAGLRRWWHADPPLTRRPRWLINSSLRWRKACS